MTSEQDKIRTVVRDSYADIARKSVSSSPPSSCCGAGDTEKSLEEVARQLGYSSADLEGIPFHSNLGLGCGNPQTMVSLQPGNVVVDLGSGAGFDCFIAANRVGSGGQVIGVDMTPQMITEARRNAREGGFRNVEFRLGEIEHLPVSNDSADVIISNCVINLSPDKAQVFRDAFRVLRRGGRLAISDVVATARLPEEIRQDRELLSGCIAGAEPIEDLCLWLQEAGFAGVEIKPWDESREFIADWAPGRKVEDLVVSASIKATKP
ncbi:MAG: arsenite methyltransferase [Planctomycetota bacterium]